MSRRILYVQYTNPAGYPPLLHSSSILAEAGWDVLFVGAPAEGAAGFTMPPHARIRHVRVPAHGGRARKRRYAAFAARCLAAALTFRPHWCYASDALSAPVALAMSRVLRTRVLYHEHDTPDTGALAPSVARARARVAAAAHVVVAPSAERLARIPHGRGERLVVWNCPRRTEVWSADLAPDDACFRIVYSGSLSRDRLTPQLIDSLRTLPDRVELDILGYETAGHRGYAQELLQRADALGVGARVRCHGPIAERAELLQRLRGHQLGIATVVAGADPNLDSLAGASNKAFEYLALGIPVLISARAEWQRMYEEPGYGVSCEPTDAESIGRSIRSLIDDAGRASDMGRRGRARILSDWNYEAQFAPVLELLEA